MAICEITQDLLKGNVCGYSLKKVTDIYLANFADVTSSTISAGTDGTYVTDFTLAAEKRFFHIEPATNSASFTDSLQRLDNGAKYRQQTVNFGVDGLYDGKMADFMDGLSLGKFVAVVKLATGEYICLGRTVGVEAITDGANPAGNAAATDTAPMAVILQADAAEIVYPLNDAAIAKVIGS
jgi:hypothetical protein